MKCRKPNTDQECSLTVLANGQPCEEYILTSQTDFASSAGDILECFIPISDGDEITLTGYFRGSVLHASFDLLADGSFVADKRIEGPKTGELKYYSQRKLDYSVVMQVPKDKGWTSIFQPIKVVEARLGVKALPQTDAKVQEIVSAMKSDGCKISLGSIAVVVSLNQNGSENHTNDYADMCCGEWENRDSTEATSGGIPPTHELEVKVEKELINWNKQSKHRRHFEQTRFGKKPWATFVFYYRSSSVIRQVGCVIRPDTWQTLLDGGEKYVEVDHAPRKLQKPVVHDMARQTPRTIQSAGAAMADLTKPQPPPKAKLFGQPLFSQSPVQMPVRESPDTLFVAQEIQEDGHDVKQIFSPLRSQNSNHSLRDGVETSSYTEIMDDTLPQARRVSSSPQALGDGVLEFGQSHAHEIEDEPMNVAGGTPGNISAVPEQNIAASQTPLATSADQSPKTMQSQSHLNHSNDCEVGAVMPRTTGHVPTHEEIRALASSGGEISFRDLVNYFDTQGINQKIGIKITAEVADNTDSSGTWYLKNPAIGFDADSFVAAYRTPETEHEVLPVFADNGEGVTRSEGVAPAVLGKGTMLRDQVVLPSIEAGEAFPLATTSQTPASAEEIKPETEPDTLFASASFDLGDSLLASSATAMAPPPALVTGMKRPTYTRSPTGSLEGTPSKRARSMNLQLREQVAAANMVNEKLLQRKVELQKRAEERNAQKERSRLEKVKREEAERLERERREEEERLEQERLEEEQLLHDLEQIRKENVELENELEAEGKRLDAEAIEFEEDVRDE